MRQVFSRKIGGKEIPFRRRGHRWEDNVKTVFGEGGWFVVDLIELVHGKVQISIGIPLCPPRYNSSTSTTYSLNISLCLFRSLSGTSAASFRHPTILVVIDR